MDQLVNPFLKILKKMLESQLSTVGVRYKVQEGVLYKIQSPFFRQIFPEGALYKSLPL